MAYILLAILVVFSLQKSFVVDMYNGANVAIITTTCTQPEKFVQSVSVKRVRLYTRLQNVIAVEQIFTMWNVSMVWPAEVNIIIILCGLDI